jgi:hypothetical protein
MTCLFIKEERMPLKHGLNLKAELTLEFLKSRVTYDPETGIFLWRNGYGGVREGFPAAKPCSGEKAKGYFRVVIDSREYKAHRLAWFYMTGDWPPDQIDHVNGIGSDNRWVNLRLANQSQNKANSRAYKNSKSQIKGVTWSEQKRKWIAVIQIDGRQKYLGQYDDVRQAAEAYRRAAEHLYGDFNRTT